MPLQIESLYLAPNHTFSAKREIIKSNVSHPMSLHGLNRKNNHSVSSAPLNSLLCVFVYINGGDCKKKMLLY